MRVHLNNLKKILCTAAAIAAVVAACGAIYSLFAHGQFSSFYVFNTNFIVGAFIILVGLITYVWPINLGRDKLIDHSTYGAKTIEAREQKRVKAYDIIYIGISNILIVAVIQYLVKI